MSDHASLYAGSQSEDPDSVPVPEEPAEVKEARSLQRLWSMIDLYAPHLQPSFVYSSAWWKIHEGMPEAHMLKYLLFKGIEDICVIFNDVEAEKPGRVRKLLKEANDEAAPIWSDQDIPFSERLARCKTILDPVVELNATSEFQFSAFPKSLSASLDELFTKFYGKPNKVLLIGRTCKHAYAVQDRYASAVASLLGTVSQGYESRATVRLRKVYGRNSIPLLCISSVSGLWKLCRIPLYRAVLSLLYKWIQPLAEAPEIRPFGCDYISSIHRFLRPKTEKRNTVFKEFYLSVLIWSGDLLIVMMLDEYVAPKPVVADYVRRQLLCNDEEDCIRTAIRDAQEGRDGTGDLYATWLSYSGLDLSDRESPVINAVVNNGLLLHALFDLMLGERVKAFILNGYTEIHDARAKIQSFFTAWEDFMEPAEGPRSPWWDGIERPRSPHQYWLSIELRQHSDFSSVFESWLNDGNHLQNWLDHFEEDTLLVNNPKDVDRIFSESTAIEVIDWAKFQGSFLDQRRRTTFRQNPGWFLEECERLGLFTARTPRFSQLFFYDFTDREMELEMGQISPSRRAAQAYLSSGVRLESSCGISEVWYRYVENRQTLFTDETAPSTPIQQNPQTALPGLELRDYHVEFMSSVFQWERQHRRPRPRRKVITNTQPTGERVDQDGQHSGSMDEITSGSPVAPSQLEDISEYTEDEASRVILAGRASQVEEERDGEAGDIIGGRASGSTAGGEEGGGFEDWPMTASFDESLSKVMGEAEGIPETPYVATGMFVPSSIPEERELCLDPALVGLTYNLTGVAFGAHMEDLAEAAEDETGEGDQMEGLEASQPAQVQAGSDVEAVSDPDIVAVEDADAMDVQDVVYAADTYSMAAHRPTRSQKGRALIALIESRMARHGPKQK